MEFRVAPFVILTLGVLLQLYTLPEWNDSTVLLDKGKGLIVAQALIGFLSVGSFFRHAYFTKGQKALFYTLFISFVLLFFKYLYQFLTF